MNTHLENYSPSSALRKVLYRVFLKKYPDANVTEHMLCVIETELLHSVRGLIATIGSGLDAAKAETYTMTQNGVLNDETKAAYLYRLPVQPSEENELYTAITEDLYKYAGTPAMVMASARLEVQNGELVIIGLEEIRKPSKSGRTRATIRRIG